MRQKIGILFLIFILSTSIFAYDNYKTKNLVLENLDPSNYVKQIYQDSTDIIWIATSKGLIRYNGVKESLFNADNKTLSDNSVNCILQNKEKLWVGTSVGLNNIDLVTGAITSFLANPESKDNLQNDNINCLFKDEKNTLYIGTNEGLYLFSEKNNSFLKMFSKLDDYFSVGQKMITALNKYQDKLFIGTQEGLLIYDYNLKSLQVLNTENSLLDANLINEIFIYQHEIYVTTEGSTYKYNIKRKTIDNSFNNRHISSLKSFDIKTLLAISENNLYILNPNLLTFDEEIQVDKDFEPYYIFVDKLKTVWLVNSSGIRLLKFDSKKITNVSDNSNQTITGQINVVALNDTKLFYTMNNSNLFSYDLTKKQITHLILNKYAKTIIISGIQTDLDGNLWIATSNEGLFYYDQKTNKIQKEESFKSPDINLMNIYQKRQLICYSNNQIMLYDIKNKITKVYKMPHNDELNYSNIEVSSICRLDNDIWIGTKNGLYSYNISSNKNTLYKKGEKSISHHSISTLFADSANNLWIGFANGDINRYDKINNSFSVYKINHWVSGICEDNNHQLWISTSNGLVKFDTEKGSLKVYKKNNKLLSDEYIIGSFACNDKIAVFGTLNGIIKLDLSKNDAYNIKSSISSFKIFDKDYDSDLKINADNGIKLSYKQNFISFDFVGLDYFNTEKIKYAYYIEGVDKGWIESGNRNYVSYTNLKGGTYKLNLKTCDSDGNWSNSIKTFSFKVIPPFWEYKLFKTLMILLILGLSFLAYHLKVSAIKASKIELENLVQLRTSELANALEEIREQKKDLEYSYYKLKETQDEIVELEKKNSLLAMAITANHEINQPLMIIKGNVELLEIQLESIETKHKKYLDRIHNSVDRISGILEKFKSIDKMKTKQYIENNDMIDLQSSAQ